MNKKTPKKVEQFLRALHESKFTGSEKTAGEIALASGLTEEQFNKLKAFGFIHQATFGLPDYRVADPLLEQLNLKPWA